MADKTEIAWCDSTFNPWIGCTKVSPGCDHCYAEADFDLRKHRVKWGAGHPRSRTSAANWKQPLQWDRQHAEFFAEHGRRRRVFCGSLCDVFDNEVPTDWRRDLFQLIACMPHLDWLLLTKRIGNARPMLNEVTFGVWNSEPWQNVWLGATIVDQEEADRDIPKLLRVPARVRFLSMEPLLGPVDLTYIGTNGYDGHYPLRRDRNADGKAIDWVIVGGESGPNARPMHPDWARSLRDQCQAAGVPFLFKQWGEWHGPANPIPGGSFGDELRRGIVQHLHAPGNPEGFFRRGDEYVRRIGKKAAGRLLDGVLHDGYPEVSA